MKILWVHSFPDLTTSASGIFMRRMQRAISDKGFTIDELYLPTRDALSLPSAIQRLRKISSNYSVVHAQFGSLCAYLVSRVTANYMISLRGSDWYEIHSGPILVRLHSKWAVTLTRRALSRPTRVICMSNKMSDQIKVKHPHIIPHTIPDGVDTSEFSPKERHMARAHLGFEDDDSVWVLFSSALKKNYLKRRELAINVIEEVERKIPNVKLIELTGIQPELVPWYLNGSNVVLLTSIHEGWPNIIKEALCCNVPFVSTDVSDLRTVAKNFSNCFVLSAQPEDLAAGIVKAVESSPDKELRNYGLRFDIEIASSALAKLYTTVSSSS